MDGTRGMEAALSRWEESGLSLRGFGTKEGISYSKLVYWRRKLRGVKSASKKAASVKPKLSADLVPVQVVADEAPTKPSSATISVWLANGISLDVPAGFEESDLSVLVKLLASC